jgi:hypothetical protein
VAENDWCEGKRRRRVGRCSSSLVHPSDCSMRAPIQGRVRSPRHLLCFIVLLGTTALVPLALFHSSRHDDEGHLGLKRSAKWGKVQPRGHPPSPHPPGAAERQRGVQGTAQDQAGEPLGSSLVSIEKQKLVSSHNIFDASSGRPHWTNRTPMSTGHESSVVEPRVSADAASNSSVVNERKSAPVGQPTGKRDPPQIHVQAAPQSEASSAGCGDKYHPIPMTHWDEPEVCSRRVNT